MYLIAHQSLLLVVDHERLKPCSLVIALLVPHVSGASRRATDSSRMANPFKVPVWIFRTSSTLLRSETITFLWVSNLYSWGRPIIFGSEICIQFPQFIENWCQVGYYRGKQGCSHSDSLSIDSVLIFSTICGSSAVIRICSLVPVTGPGLESVWFKLRAPQSFWSQEATFWFCV